jgi:predicted PhzF superfamily epimerase YddE/YHI9
MLYHMFKIFQVDAFTDTLLSGNPAAVVPLDAWLPDALMQQLAAENNLAETAFIVPTGAPDTWHLRWFTPTVEVRLCGHATLATAFVLFNCLKVNQSDTLYFETLSGQLSVRREGDWFVLDFPADYVQPAELPTAVLAGFNRTPLEVWRGRDDFMMVFAAAADIAALAPDFRALALADARGIICTAPGMTADFVSRCFFPASGIDEDPVTGSAHTAMTPYWAEKLNKTTLIAIQQSTRSGYLRCTLQGDRVMLAGQGRLYLEGHFYIA